jgi:hypothetical protein
MRRIVNTVVVVPFVIGIELVQVMHHQNILLKNQQIENTLNEKMINFDN